jgi:hypothetical protein
MMRIDADMPDVGINDHINDMNGRRRKGGWRGRDPSVQHVE